MNDSVRRTRGISGTRTSIQPTLHCRQINMRKATGPELFALCCDSQETVKNVGQSGALMQCYMPDCGCGTSIRRIGTLLRRILSFCFRLCNQNFPQQWRGKCYVCRSLWGRSDRRTARGVGLVLASDLANGIERDPGGSLIST